MKKYVSYFITFTKLFLFVLFLSEAAGKVIIIPDEYSKIQDGINSANSGDTVLVKPGDYHEFIVLKDSVVLMSEGVDDGNWNRALMTKIHSDGLRDGDDNITPVVNMADGAVLDGFEITGMDTVNHHLPGHSHAVQNRGTSGIVMNCLVHHNGSTGIGSHEKDEKPAHPTIIHNKVYNNFGIGIGFNQFSAGVAKDNIVYENRETGIGIQNGASPLIEHNTVYNNGWNGISAREGAKPKVKNNTSYSNGTDTTGEGAPEGNGVGIGADSTGWMFKPEEVPSMMFIENNIVYDNPGGGVMARNKAQVFLRGNQSYNNDNFQITLSDSSNGFVDSNIVYNNVDSKYQGGGIVVIRGSHAELVRNNVSGSNLAGVMVSDGAFANLFDNEIYNNKQAGIRLDSNINSINISNNRIYSNSSLGIIIVSASAGIYKNLLEFNTNGAISIDGQSQALIYNNTIYSESDTSRGIYTVSSETKIMNNIIVGYKVGVFKTGTPEIDYNCTYLNNGYNGPPGTGGENALIADPLFINADEGDFHLSSSSPCIDRGNPDPIYNDPDGSRTDIGCYPFEKPNSIEYFNFETELINIYPSIVTDILKIYLSDELVNKEVVVLNVYDILGNVAAQIKTIGNELSWDAWQLMPGVYIVQIQDKEANTSKRFIKY